MKQSQTVTVLDIGSSKVCCCIANVYSDGSYIIIGTGYCMCVGVKNGVITDLDLVKKSIIIAIENAEKVSGFHVRSLYVNISGKNLFSDIKSSSIQLNGRAVEYRDIDYLLKLCNEDFSNKSIVHSIPIMYSIDSIGGIKNPIGMIADVITVNTNVVTALPAQVKNIIACIDMCHLYVSGVVASGYAAGLCVFDANEMQLPHIVIDFGASGTSLSFFYNGIFCGTENIPIGGRHITSDIAYGLNISISNAERLKTLYGSAFVSMEDDRETIMAPVMEDENLIDLQQISKGTLNQIIQPRVEEILLNIVKKIEKSRFNNDFLDCGVILTGGGSQLTGLRDFSSNILNRKVKIKNIATSAESNNFRISNDFSVAIGMIKFAQMKLKRKSSNKRSDQTKSIGFFKKISAFIDKFDNN